MTDNWLHEWDVPNHREGDRLFPDELLKNLKIDTRIPEDCIGITQGDEIHVMRLGTNELVEKIPIKAPGTKGERRTAARTVATVVTTRRDEEEEGAAGEVGVHVDPSAPPNPLEGG
jgi:hypothetical protein